MPIAAPSPAPATTRMRDGIKRMTIHATLSPVPTSDGAVSHEYGTTARTNASTPTKRPETRRGPDRTHAAAASAPMANPRHIPAISDDASDRAADVGPTCGVWAEL